MNATRLYLSRKSRRVKYGTLDDRSLAQDPEGRCEHASLRLSKAPLLYRAQLPAHVVRPEVSVRAVARQNRLHHWEGMNKIGPIPKDCDIHFEVTNPWVLPIGAEIEWMVRNEGDEAEFVNDLGHKPAGDLRAKELSAYNGRHYMDCVVKRLEKKPGRVSAYVATVEAIRKALEDGGIEFLDGIAPGARLG